MNFGDTRRSRFICVCQFLFKVFIKRRPKAGTKKPAHLIDPTSKKSKKEVYDGKETDDYWFFVNRWFDTSEDDGAIEREIIPTEENGHPLGDSDCTCMKHHTNLQKFARGFINYKKGALDSQLQVIKLTSWLPMVGGSLRILRLLPTLKLVAMI